MAPRIRLFSAPRWEEPALQEAIGPLPPLQEDPPKKNPVSETGLLSCACYAAMLSA